MGEHETSMEEQKSQRKMFNVTVKTILKRHILVGADSPFEAEEKAASAIEGENYMILHRSEKYLLLSKSQVSEVCQAQEIIA